METLLALLVGLLVAVATFLILSPSIFRLLLGIGVLGNAVNLMIFTGGRLTPVTPPIIHEGETALIAPYANPLPQALILTAIVIGFAFFAYALMTAVRASRDFGHLDARRLDAAERPELVSAEPADIESFRARKEKHG
ncbi:MAG: NADH-quinone oxidoreductase subunit K [Alphaproteobacteria bacterium]|nr:NADH-quinone oxidoreductase subunit K [Alphaproteobacteria bacterium]